MMELEPEFIRWDRTTHGWHVIIGLKPETPRPPSYSGFDYELPPFTYYTGAASATMTKLWLYRATTLLIQAILGDDPKRSAYNFKRFRHGIWLNQLFEPKGTR